LELLYSYERLNQYIKQENNNGRMESMEKTCFLETVHSATWLKKIGANILSKLQLDSLLLAVQGFDSTYQVPDYQARIVHQLKQLWMRNLL
jgi:hypothetical protein